MDNDRVEVDVAFPADAFCFVKNWRNMMDKPWLLSPKDITWQQWKSDPNAVCRAQHLKTLEWVEAQLQEWVETSLGNFLKQSPTKAGQVLTKELLRSTLIQMDMQPYARIMSEWWKDVLAQAKKDVGDG